MTTATFESLPNELWLLVFNYLSVLDLGQAFLDLNTRIDRIVAFAIRLSGRHSLDVSSQPYALVKQFFTGSISPYLNLLIHTLRLDGSLPCFRLCEHWITKGHTWLPYLEQIRLSKQVFTSRAAYFHGQYLSLLLANAQRIPCRLYCKFEDPSRSYTDMLAELIEQRISFHTMVLDVQQGYDPNERDDYYDDLIDLYNKMKSLYWPNTVKLIISLQYPNELGLLLKRDALPMLENLSVTIERHTSYVNRSCKHKLWQLEIDGTRLRSLLLRNMPLDDLLVFLEAFAPMSCLDSLALIDVHDSKLDRLAEFQRLVESSISHGQGHLYYSFQIPVELEHQLSFNSLLNNPHVVGYHLDEVHRSFRVYTRSPPSCLFVDRRRLYHPSEVDEVLKSSRHVQSLHWTKYGYDSTLITVVDSTYRSFTFYFKSNLTTSNAMRLLLSKAATRLTHLSVEWRDLRGSPIRFYPLLTRVHLVFARTLTVEPPAPKRLAQIMPFVRQLSTSGGKMVAFGQSFVTYIVDVIREFQHLVTVVVNKDGQYQPNDEDFCKIYQALRTMGDERLRRAASERRINFRINNEIRIWL